MKTRLMLAAGCAALLLTGATAQAGSTVNTIVPITLDVFVPCADGGNGEMIHLEGPLKVLTSISVDKAGGLHYNEQYNPQGVTGVGLTTGAKYNATGKTSQDIVLGAGDSLVEQFVNRFNMIGQGPGNNFKTAETLHLTVTPNGDVTAFLDHFSVTCQ
jgi:hypothetical protein